MDTHNKSVSDQRLCNIDRAPKDVGEVRQLIEVRGRPARFILEYDERFDDSSEIHPNVLSKD